MWVMIKRDIPVSLSVKPLLFDIYWAEPWVDKEKSIRQFMRTLCRDTGLTTSAYMKRSGRLRYEVVYQKVPEFFFLNPWEVREMEWEECMDYIEQDMFYAFKYYVSHDCFIDDCGGVNPNVSLKLQILNKGERVGVWACEVRILTVKDMRDLIGEGYYDFHTSSVPEKDQEMDVTFENYQKDVYEAALLDGCTEVDAKLTALGVDILAYHEGGEFPPVGWYSLKDEYRTDALSGIWKREVAL